MVNKLKSPLKNNVLDQLEEEYQMQNPDAPDVRKTPAHNSQAQPKLIRRNFDIQESTDQRVDILRALLKRKSQNYTKQQLYDLLLQRGLETFKELEGF